MLLETLAAYGAHDSVAALPAPVIHHAKRAVLDWLSALYPGTTGELSPVMLQAYRAELGFGASSLPGAGTTAFPATAAWINGSVSHAVEFDDIFRDAVYHPGCPTVAAALAIAEDIDATGLQLLNAIVVGYEISTRIGAAVQPSHYRYFHTTGTVGCFGAAAAAAALLAPGNASVMQHALATAASMAAGLQQAFRSDAMTKAMHAGHAANVGVRAAQVAAAGATGVPDILEGEVGFGAALSTNPNWAAATRSLGSDYNITHITQKNHGCCGHTFAAIDAALALRDQGIAAQDIRELRVKTYKAALDVTGNFQPETVFECKFSLPYVVSHALIHGSVRMDAFGEQRMADAAVRDLMTRIALTEDAELTAGFPSMRAAHVAATTADGREHAHFAPFRKGDPELPLTDAELNGKFDELAGPILGPVRCQTLRQAVWRLDTLNVRDLALNA